MTIYADARGGSLILERRIDGRRFRRATGLPDTPKGRDTATRYDSMLAAFSEAGRTDLVRGLADGVLGFADVWPHYRTGAWTRIPSPEHMAPLYAAVAAWLPTSRKPNGQPMSARHRTDIANAFKMLAGLQPNATVADCPKLLRAYRAECERRGIGRTFRKAKNAMQAFLRETQGRRHSALWAEVSDVADVAYTRSVTRAVPVARAMAIRDALSPPHAAIWWAMCCSGMMPDELWGGKWRVLGDGLAIGGTKTAFRLRTVPLLVAPRTPERAYLAFRKALKKVDPTLAPYVARRCYGFWIEDAGINPTRSRLYMGHRAKDSHDLYPEHDVTPYLAADAATLRAYIEREASE